MSRAATVSVMGRAMRPGRRRPLSDAQFRRAARQAGDTCGGCGRRLRGTEAVTVGPLGGRLTAVAGCCAGRLSKISGEGLYIAVDGSAPWQIADRDWFAAHPDRSHRLRAALPGEMPGADW